MQVIEEPKTCQDDDKSLKAVNERMSDERYREGVESGNAWAMNHAKGSELTRLANFCEGVEQDTWGWPGFFDCQSAYGYSNPQSLAFVILGKIHDGNTSAAERFWASKGNLPADQQYQAGDLLNAFLRGFIDGAMKDWNQMKKP
jgi:hypothetical protein